MRFIKKAFNITPSDLIVMESDGQNDGVLQHELDTMMFLCEVKKNLIEASATGNHCLLVQIKNGFEDDIDLDTILSTIKECGFNCSMRSSPNDPEFSNAIMIDW